MTHDARRPSRARGRTAPSAGCRPTATGSGCRRRACGCRCAARQSSAKARSRAGSSSGPARKRRAASRSRCSRRSTRAGRCRPICRSPATSATGAGDLGAVARGRRPAPGARSGRGRSGRRARPPRRRWATSSPASAAAARAGAHHRRRPARAPPAAALGRRARGATLPMARDQRGAVEARRRGRARPPARRASPRCGRRSTRISPRRCEIRMHAAAAGGEAADVGEQLAGEHAVERRGRLVEDDELAPARR